MTRQTDHRRALEAVPVDDTRSTDDRFAIYEAQLVAFAADLADKLLSLEPGGSIVVGWSISVGAPPRDRAWSEAVKRRDGHRCTKCGRTDRLQAHHVLTRAEHPEYATDVSNGRTLCVGCHADEHPDRANWIRSQHGGR